MNLPFAEGHGRRSHGPIDARNSHEDGRNHFEAEDDDWPGGRRSNFEAEDDGRPCLLRAPEAEGREGGGPLRLIHVGPSLARGGAETWLVDLLRFLDPRRVRVLRSVVTSSHVDPDVVADLDGLPVEVGGAEAVRRAAAECDVMVGWGSERIGPWLADSATRPPVFVLVAHGEGGWTRDVVRSCASVVDHVVAVGEGVRRRIEDGIPCSVIPNGVDAGRLARSRPRGEVRRALGFGPDDFVLGYVGRFAKEKRVERLIGAVAGLPASYKALLVGWGPLRGDLMDLANEQIPGRFAFARASRYLGDYYQAMDAACLLSDQEGFALVTLEAMMCGRPLIVTPVGAVPEIIVDRVNGLVVPGSPESVGQAAALLRCHPAWARGMAEEARAFAEEHGHARLMARRYEDLFLRLWREKRGGRPRDGRVEDDRCQMTNGR